MSRKDSGPVVIVGAGVSGLTLAVLLQGRGIPCILVEKDEQVGGLARSFRYDDYTFDIGPHRFHTAVKEVDSFVRDTLGPDGIEIPRNSQVQFMGHRYQWPLRPGRVLLRFPPRVLLSIARDLMVLYKIPNPVSFRDHIENMYGHTLYRKFFEGYSSKFLGITPELTDIDWATTGIDRAIIDNRLKMHSLWQLGLSALLPSKGPPTLFVYPRRGCGQFTDLMAELFVRSGGELLTGTEISGLETDGRSVVSVEVGGRSIRPSQLVWTGTIHSAAKLLGLPSPSLRYLSLVCYNLMLSEGEHFDFQWCYHGAPEVIFSRTSIPANFCPLATPSGQRSLCVEVSCREEDDVYNAPERHLERVLDDLKREELLKTDSEVVGVRYERAPWAYPIYKLGYRKDLDATHDCFKPFANLTLAGRLGKFWYNNMDHCIEASMALAEDISKRLAHR
jgi:protoporphyrinogen oxidase